MTNNSPRCKHCGSTNVYGISRVVGFFSKIEDWNKSKKAEFNDRQKGNYSIEKKEEKITQKECISIEE
ncbi:MAG: anaerobic ribonucleoside-triphosphate reductase [Candidatus Nanoarchaeia archaeon]|jgi:ribonucleoside-triphosphate reductase